MIEINFIENIKTQEKDNQAFIELYSSGETSMNVILNQYSKMNSSRLMKYRPPLQLEHIEKIKNS